MEIWQKILLWIFILFLLFFSAFFSAAETAYTSVKKTKISIEVNKGNKKAKLIQKQYENFATTLSTILVLNNIVNIAISTFTAFLISNEIGEGILTTIITTIVIAPIIIILGEILPKLFAKKYSYSYLKLITRSFIILNFIFYPLTYPLSKLNFSSQITNTEKELQSYLDVASKEGVLEKQEATIASNALRLDSTLVDDIFVSRDKIISLKNTDNSQKILKTFSSSGHSRLPVIKNKKYIGIIILKDFIYNPNVSLEELVVSIPYISKNTLINLALEKMRSIKSHVAFVTKNNKSREVIGLITIEDIIEELIGELYDEHDKTKPIREIGLYKYRASGNASMKLLTSLTKIDYKHTKDQNLKSWIQSRINRKIKKDLKYTYKQKVEFKIVSNKNNKDIIIDIRIK